MATIIEAQYCVTTPMFCGGANSPDSANAELRLPSFKGALRFWWRALAWSRLGGQLETIKQQEDALFGSTRTGQSRVLMHLHQTARLESIPRGRVLTVTKNGKKAVGAGARYLGYGVMEAFDGKNTTEGLLNRSCLYPAFEFTIRIRGRNLQAEELASLRNALIALGLFGGMGAKSRKGYGSLVLQSLHMDKKSLWEAPHSVEDLCNRINGLRPDGEPHALPPYTALTRQTRHVLVTANKNLPVELLDLVGREMIRYRSWGHRGKVLGNPSERNFKDDHDLMKHLPNSPQSHPRRIAFGLPHNYGRGHKQQVGPQAKDLDRRASPLFIHIHQCGTRPVAVLSFLPAAFLPKGQVISVGGKQVDQAPEDTLYQPIHDFLDRLLNVNEKKRKEPFRHVMEVSA